MGKKNKSKRFVQQGADAVMQHAARFPYRGTLADAEKERNNSSLGGV
ncbi:competence protein [Bacillus pfraonensis]|nr:MULTISPECIES: competence protein [unclassified Bacillus (in: firmicutes)]MBC6971543.1 competence protein [Bacillus sp. Xin]MCI0766469.1 competence protein [Bacillus sp. TL12]NSW39253.1 competence protein [Bacillus sp. Xin1]HEK9099683.1 competence protein [Bacillus pseudomycoides]